jgi:hypothetical protein
MHVSQQLLIGWMPAPAPSTLRELSQPCRLVLGSSTSPIPLCQIKLLKILALLGVADKAASENMYSVLADVLRKSDTGATIGNAILYECICTVTSIYPNTKLLGQSAEVTSRFLKVRHRASTPECLSLQMFVCVSCGICGANHEHKDLVSINLRTLVSIPFNISGFLMCI